MCWLVQHRNFMASRRTVIDIVGHFLVNISHWPTWLGGVSRPPLSRRGPGPSPEGMAEGAEFRVAKEEGDLREAQILISEIPDCQIMAKFVQNLTKAHPQVA